MSQQWPVTGKEKPGMIIFDPPYFQKMAEHYEEGSISDLSKEEYLGFLKEFFLLAHEQTSPSACIAFINGDWRDFQGVTPRGEDRSLAILSFDYERILRESGWEVRQTIMCPLSTQRFHPHMVTSMQKKRSLGTVSRYLLVAMKK